MQSILRFFRSTRSMALFCWNNRFYNEVSAQFYLDVVEKEEQKNNIFITFHNNRPINIQAAAV